MSTSKERIRSQVAANPFEGGALTACPAFQALLWSLVGRRLRLVETERGNRNMPAFVEMPLSYRALCKPFRARHAGSVQLLDFVTLRVRETTGDDAPVAVEIADGLDVELLRWFDGRYWIADNGSGIPSGHIRAKLGMGTEGDIAKLASESLFLVRTCPHVVGHFKARTRMTVESERCRDVTGTDREAALARLELRVREGLLMVDGVLHAAVQEPFLTLTLSDDGFASSSVWLGMPYLDGARNRTFVFPVDRQDDLEAVLASVIGDGVSLHVNLRAEYLHGDTTPVRREAEDVLLSAKCWIEKESHKIREWSRDRAMAWFDLRDRCQEAVEAPRDERVLDGLSEALVEYGRHADIGPFAKAATERWQMRHIELEPEASGPAPR